MLITLRGELYEPDEAGEPAWVLPVCVVDPEIPEEIEATDPLAVVAGGPVVDLLAFSPLAPGRWALRHGLATVLGAIPPQHLDPEPVRVHRDVTRWLRAECSGIVLLTADRYQAARVVHQIEAIVAEDKRHADELTALLTMPLPLRSRITVPTPSMAVA